MTYSDFRMTSISSCRSVSVVFLQRKKVFTPCKKTKSLFMNIVLLMFALPALAQSGGTVTVSGVVTSAEDKYPLIGAHVIAGDNNGVSTLLDGSYSIDVKPGDVLTYYYVGYEEVKYTVPDGAASIKHNVELKAETKSLEDVVVIAYGVRKKGTIAGSVSTVKAEKIENTPTAAFDQALQGQVPGLTVLSSSGEPSVAATLSIRGTNSINSGTAPLYILDGAAISSADFNTINPADIESISVRTDASSRFGADRRWAGFWSVSFMWNLRQERFMDNASRWLTNAQIAVSTGTSGNSSIPNYEHLALVSGGSDYFGNAGIAPSQPGSDNLGWEKLWTTNLAFHLGFWNRLNVDLEFYNKRTSDMLMLVPESYANKGYGYSWDNIGVMVNRGFELNVTGTIFSNRNFMWSVNANVSYNRNRILELYNGVQEYEMSQTSMKLVVGHDSGEFYINRFAGVNPVNGDALRPHAAARRLRAAAYCRWTRCWICWAVARSSVSSPSMRYEERTRRAELHLWYAVRFGKEFTVDEVISRLSQLGEVQTATPNRVIKRAYREDRKAYPVSQRMLERSAVTRASGDYAYNDVLLPWQWHIINRGYRDNFVIGDTDGKTVEEVQAKYKAGADVNCEKAWERTTGDPSIVVAVLDEGIYWRHPDLVNNMWENEDEPYYSDAAGEHVSYEDRDGNGYAGDHFGYDFINNTGVISCDASSDTGHGTHVAGVIAARNNNGIGIASIAGGTEDAPGVKVMSCQIFSGNKTSSTINLVRAIKYAADNGAVILQCSWGYASPAANGFEYSPGFATEEEWEANCPLEKTALDYFVHNAGSPNGPIEGGIPIFASGNEYAAAGGFPGAAEYCISVNATAADYTISTFSNYGEFTDIAAPGGDQDYYYEYFDGDNVRGAVGCVLSTLPPQVSNGTGYGYMEGTSMACPHVSGVAALGLSYAVQLRKHFTADEFRRMLIETASPIDDYLVGTKYYYFYVTDIDKTRYTSVSLSRYHGCSGGLVNAERLLEAIADDAAGSKMTFPNIYLAPGEESAVTETPARYFVGGETLTYTLQIADTSVAEGVITAEGKALFTGVGEGVTTASITASNGETQNFNITVRKGAAAPARDVAGVGAAACAGQCYGAHSPGGGVGT